MTDKIDTKSRHITPAGGNIFADLGFEPKEAAALKAQSDAEIARTVEMKIEIMGAITQWMKQTGHKQEAAARIMHVSRPRVSDVVNKKTEKFTLDSLVGMASTIGKKVHLVIE
ncbi:XRE family transcriptional regulator [Enterobacter sp. WCHEn045836]|uniref:helix-turn-helix domain-containing protein n=1 Tax=Enterobacter sp. WCHEn045836 TaxID=2497434 RepID=UPI000F8340B4|nr:XRE family transcriptional regulator [Enterobacter sp. WCHEn045836]RTP98373.1 XRE family transcriptional regulator [Enterobacter sp. WCHEn045836]